MISDCGIEQEWSIPGIGVSWICFINNLLRMGPISALIKRKSNFPHTVSKKIQNGAVAKSYMTNGLLIYGEIFAHFLIRTLGSPSSYMTLQLLHSEFHYIWGKFEFLFYQCVIVCTVIRFLWVSAKFGTCTVVSVNGTLVEDKLCTFTLESTNFIFNLYPIYTHDGASAKFSAKSQETDYSVGRSDIMLL